MMETITQSKLKELFEYNPDTGLLTWIVSAGRVRAGTVVSRKCKYGYVIVQIDKKRHFAHRLAWIFVHGDMTKDQIDHINGIKSDNRICNLREANRSENGQNQRKAQSRNKLGILGVSWSKAYKGYIASIRVDGKLMVLGKFSNPELASHGIFGC